MDTSKIVDYDWSLKAAALPPGSEINIVTVGSNYKTGCFTTNKLAYAPDKVPVLRGFDVAFRDKSLPLNQFKVKVFRDGSHAKVTVCMNDKTKNDEFTFWVGYALVPDDKVYYMERTNYDDGGKAEANIATRTGSDWNHMLTGFNFRFHGRDGKLEHPIREIGLVPEKWYIKMQAYFTGKFVVVVYGRGRVCCSVR